MRPSPLGSIHYLIFQGRPQAVSWTGTPGPGTVMHASIFSMQPRRRITLPGPDRGKVRPEQTCGSTLRNQSAARRPLTEALPLPPSRSNSRFRCRPDAALRHHRWSNRSDEGLLGGSFQGTRIAGRFNSLDRALAEIQARYSRLSSPFLLGNRTDGRCFGATALLRAHPSTRLVGRESERVTARVYLSDEAVPAHGHNRYEAGFTAEERRNEHLGAEMREGVAADVTGFRPVTPGDEV